MPFTSQAIASQKSCQVSCSESISSCSNNSTDQRSKSLYPVGLTLKFPRSNQKTLLVKLLRKIKQHTDSLVGLKIAVMGCIVNGPGEMLGADYGIVGSSKGHINLYKKGKIVEKRIPENETVKALTTLIKLSGDWKDKLS